MKKILLVDDEQDIVETLKFVLESEGYKYVDGEIIINVKEKSNGIKLLFFLFYFLQEME